MATSEKLRIDIVANSSDAVAGVKKVGITIDELKDKVKYYQDLAFAEKDLTKLRNYNSELQKIQTTLKQTSNVGKVGFDDMGVAVKNTTNGLGHAFEGVRKLAYILPGIGMAGLFNLAFEGIMSLVTGLDTAESRLTKFKDSYLKITSEAQGKGQAELAQVRALVDAIEDTSISTDHRTEALKKLQKEYPEYFNNQNLDITKTNELELATEKLSAAIIRKSQVQAISNLLDKEYTALAEEQNSDIVQKLKNLNGASMAWDAITGSLKQFTAQGQTVAIATKLFGDAQKDSAEKAKEHQSNIDKLSQSLKGYMKLQVENGDLRKEEAKKGGSTLERVYPYKQAKVTDPRHLEEMAINEDLKERLALLKAITNEIGAQALKEKKKDFFNTPKWLNPENKSDALKGYEEQENQRLLDRLNLFAKIRSEQTEWNNKMSEQIGIAQAVGNELGRAFQAVLTAKNPFEALTLAVKQLVIDLAVAVAKMLIIKAIVAVLNPGAAIGNIVGGVIAGTATGMNGRASGGTVTGPLSGYPVTLHGTEHIVRPDQMNRIIGGAAQMGQAMGGGSMGGEFVLRGSDLVLATQRANYSLNLRRGG